MPAHSIRAYTRAGVTPARYCVRRPPLGRHTTPPGQGGARCVTPTARENKEMSLLTSTATACQVQRCCALRRGAGAGGRAGAGGPRGGGAAAAVVISASPRPGAIPTPSRTAARVAGLSTSRGLSSGVSCGAWGRAGGSGRAGAGGARGSGAAVAALRSASPRAGAMPTPSRTAARVAGLRCVGWGRDGGWAGCRLGGRGLLSSTCQLNLSRC